MKTLAQMRNSVLKKLNKRRKLKFSSSVLSSGSKSLKTSDKKRKAETARRNLFCRVIDTLEKHDHEGCQGDQSLCSSSKGKIDGGKPLTVSLKRRRKPKKKKVKVVPDEAAQLQRRARYLLVKMKLEQNLIDAYSGEGWKGQSREKIKPEKELQRAKNQIHKCKLGIRDTLHQLDLLGSVGQIDEALIAPDGSVHHEHIICKKCRSQEVSEDNDIILCDGSCNCAFHQKCIDPPLATEDIPPEEEGWLCKYCDCKVEILDALNAHLGTLFSADTPWQDIFKEEALLSNVGTEDANLEEKWPDDESDDNDYDPDRDEYDSTNRCSMEDVDSHAETSTSSSCCSLESEVLSESGFSAAGGVVSSKIASLHQTCVVEFNNNEIATGPRKRCVVDYKKLYDEMFGKEKENSNGFFSEDEDWNPSKRRRREKENDVANTLMSLREIEVKKPDPPTSDVGDNHLPCAKARKPLSRIPCEALQKLRQSFAENELPSRDVKRRISELVGLEYKKVNKWFKNARYMALKNKKRERVSDNSIIGFAVNKSAEVTLTKFSSTPISTHKKKRRVSWKDNLITFINIPKKQQTKETLHVSNTANVEPSDDMCLKKHLLYLKASKQRKSVKHDIEQPQESNVEQQMEDLCRIQEKLWKLKQVLSTIPEIVTKESEEVSLNGQIVVYVPVARLKEKE
ncbi:unnamed protein product [Amaranthus hypochondriacus]